MNIDVVIGSAGDEKGLALRHSLRPNAVLTVSPLAAIEAIRGKLRQSEKIDMLRIFLLKNESQFPTSQLARLAGLFAADGSVNIFVSAPTGQGDSRTAGNIGGFAGSGGFNTGGFGGFSISGGFNIGGTSGTVGGFNIAGAGFNIGGGFNLAGAPGGFGGQSNIGGFNIGGFSGGSLGGNLLHLSNILKVPVTLSGL
jgi:hypothetical protein